MSCNMYFGDSYLILEPIIPHSVIKALTYWHRSLGDRKDGKKGSVAGETRKLYVIEPRVSRVTQQVESHLITLPGFAYKIKSLVEAEGIPVNFIDERSSLPPLNIPEALSKLREYQKPGVYTMLKSYGGILCCPTGWGKCASPSTPVIYVDGTIRKMGDVKVGDVLMGDDSTPREVLNRIEGNGPMYRITPKNGDPFEIADHHILSLVKSGDCKRDKYPDGHIVDITLSDYLSSSATFKHRYKLYKVAVEWPHKDVLVDPYWLGAWLGDGDWSRPTITTPDPEVVEAIDKYASALGAKMTTYPARETHPTNSYAIVTEHGSPNPLLTNMRSYGLFLTKEKRIPNDFKVNSREVRLQLLAGLIDSDGSLNEGTDFDFAGTNAGLVEDVAFVARSLGFRVHSTTRLCKGFGKEVTAYRLRITGDTHLIPTRVPRKQAAVRSQKKHPLRTSFTVERIDDGPYVGVQLTGNHRYLFGDFTVTHNTHAMAGILRGFSRDELNARGTPLTVIVTPGTDLAEKNAIALQKVLDDREVGLVCTGRRDFSDDIQVVTPESTQNIDMASCGLLLYDECHTLSASRADAIMQASKAIRYGFSATPTGRFDGADLVTEGCFGPVVYRRTYQQAVEDGAVVPIYIVWIPVSKPHAWRQFATRDGAYRNAVWKNKEHHKLTKAIFDHIPLDMQAIAVVDKLSHMDGVLQEMPELTYTHGSKNFKDLEDIKPKVIKAVSGDRREKVRRMLETGECMRAIASGIYRVGVDFPKLEVLINLAGMKSSIINTQLPGRTGRSVEGKDASYLIDFWYGWDTIQLENGEVKDGPLLSDCKARQKVYQELGFTQYSTYNLKELFRR